MAERGGGGRVALVTGASTGIGLDVAKKLMERGIFVVLTARGSSLNRFQGMGFLSDTSRHWIRSLDVSCAEERRELMAEIDTKLGRLDILVNNAAVIFRRPIEYALNSEGIEQMLVNFHSPIELIKLSLPLMRRQGAGHIINISSAAGFFAVPTMGFYAASKHALEGASEALYHEVRPWNIHITLVEPGFVSSRPLHVSVHENSRLELVGEECDEASDVVGLEYGDQARTISALVDNAFRLTNTTPKDIAESVCKLVHMAHPPFRHLVTLDARTFRFLKRYLPDSLFERLVAFCLNSINREPPRFA